jgi:RNA polymerase subunit RPABC4/transcription elongation factor Spt4
MDEFIQENPEWVQQQSVLTDDAVPLCPNCLEPCNPRDNYCPNCGSNETINPLASYMPFVDIRFSAGMVGKLWRRTWAPETHMIDRAIYIGLFFLFYPFMLVVGLPVLIYEKLKGRKQKQDLLA